MEKCKWQFKLFNHYFRMTVEGRFVILGFRGEHWKEVFKINKR